MIICSFLTALSPVKYLAISINIDFIHVITATNSSAESKWSRAKTIGPQVKANNSLIDCTLFLVLYWLLSVARTLIDTFQLKISTFIFNFLNQLCKVNENN